MRYPTFPRRSRRRRFTLIELLVVVVIILILAAMLMPALAGAIERGRFAACSGNLKQLQSASLLYSGDNDRRLLEHRQWVSNGYNWSTSTAHIKNGTLYAYTNATEVYLCPTFELLSSSVTPYRSYSMNWNLGEEENIANAQKLKRLTSLDSPTTMESFTGENSWTIGGYTNHALNDGSLVAGPVGSPVDNVATYHLTSTMHPDSGWSAVSYMDGHVGRIQMRDPYNELRQ